MALLPTNADGAALVYANASASDTYVNTGREKLHVRNGGGGACTVTIVASGTCNQGSLHNRTYTVPAGEDRIIPAQPVDRFGGVTNVTFSPTTSVTVGVIA